MARRPIFIAIACGATFNVLPLYADAPAMEPEEAVEHRIAGFRELGTEFKNLNDMVKSGASNKSLLQASVAHMRSLAKLQESWFPPGTEPSEDLKTRALAEIWEKQQDFRQLQVEFVQATTKLEAVAGQGDLDALKAQIRATGQLCKSCHDRFRNPEELDGA